MKEKNCKFSICYTYYLIFVKPQNGREKSLIMAITKFICKIVFKSQTLTTPPDCQINEITLLKGNQKRESVCTLSYLI